MASPGGAIPANANMAPKSFNELPIELNQKIAFLLADKDLASFRRVCQSTHQAIDADGCSFWRRRFVQVFETPALRLSGRRLEDNEKYRNEYQTRKRVLHVIEPVFQKHGEKPKLKFDMGRTRNEKLALRVLRDLIIDAFSDKKDATDVDYKSKNMGHILGLIHKTNLLQIMGLDAGRPGRDSKDTSFLYAIQAVLAPELFSFNDWHKGYHFGYHDAQVAAYDHNIMAPIFVGHHGFDIQMPWLLKNIQFWRHHLLLETEPLMPAFEALEDFESPQWWASKLSQGDGTMGSYWKGSYAFVERSEIHDVRLGRSGQGNRPIIIDQLNGEDDPNEAFQSVEVAVCNPPGNFIWPNLFENVLRSRVLPPAGNTVTRAQRSAHGANAARDFSAKAVRFQGEGTDDNEDFRIDGWLNPLPPQHGIPGWKRMTMMKYFESEEDGIDVAALWAYEGVMLPGGKIMIGRWWCPADGTGASMYSGPFLLWNVKGPEDDDEEDECIGCSNKDTADAGPK